MIYTDNKIIDELSKRTGILKEDAKELFFEFRNIIADAYMRDDVVKITGLGSFQNREVAERVYATLEMIDPVQIGAHKRPIFIASPVLSRMVKERTMQPIEKLIPDDELIAKKKKIMAKKSRKKS